MKKNQRIGIGVTLLVIIITMPVLFHGPKTEVPVTSQPEKSFVSEPEITMFRNDAENAVIMGWDDCPFDDVMVSFLENEIGVTHTSFVVTSRIGDFQRLYMLDMMFRGHDIQSHGWKHVDMGNMTDTEELHKIVNQSVVDIESYFGFRPSIFAYPFGRSSVLSSEVVLEYFDIARGVRGEPIYGIGEWNDIFTPYCPHSLSHSDGVCIDSLDQILRRFDAMLHPPAEPPFNQDSDFTVKSIATGRVFKLYGHTFQPFMNHSSIESFIEIIKTIRDNNDVWFSSWGEIFGYRKVRDNSLISEFMFDGDMISFSILSSVTSDYPIPITIRQEVPKNWNPSVIVNDMRMPYIPVTENNKSFILIDCVPNADIVITNEVITSEDLTNPRHVIRNIDFRYIANGTVVTFYIDSKLYVQDVNVTIDGKLYEHVHTPIFWNNGTYGVVVYEHIDRYCSNISISIL